MPHKLEGANFEKTLAGVRACRINWKEEKNGVYKRFSTHRRTPGVGCGELDGRVCWGVFLVEGVWF